MTWEDLARSLPLGHKTRCDCPQCGEGTSTNAMMVSHSMGGYSGYCFACGYSPFISKGKQTLAELEALRALNEAAEAETFEVELPHDFTTEIPLEGRLWLYKAGINEPRWRKLGIGYSESLRRVVFPVFETSGDPTSKLQWVQCRALLAGQRPKYIQPASSPARVCAEFGKSAVQVVLTEDLLSAARVGEQYRAISLLGTKLQPATMAACVKAERVYVWLDPDGAGQRGAAAIRRSLGLVTEVIVLTSDKDPKYLSNKQIREVIENG
jgi:hypothetical protein